MFGLGSFWIDFQNICMYIFIDIYIYRYIFINLYVIYIFMDLEDVWRRFVVRGCFDWITRNRGLKGVWFCRLAISSCFDGLNYCFFSYGECSSHWVDIGYCDPKALRFKCQTWGGVLFGPQKQTRKKTPNLRRDDWKTTRMSMVLGKWITSPLFWK